MTTRVRRAHARAREDFGELTPDELARLLRLPPFRTRPRPRRDGCDLITDRTRLGAEWFGAEYETRAWPTPHGGWRYTIACPRCGRFVVHLYGLDRGGPGSRVWACRTCMGLKYPSEYTLRRPRASKERMAALWAGIRRARSPAVRERRWARVEAERQAMQRYELRWLTAFAKGEPKWLRDAERECGLR